MNKLEKKEESERRKDEGIKELKRDETKKGKAKENKM